MSLLPAQGDWGSRLCVLRLAHLLSVIFSCAILTRTSVLHLGQYSGKLYITVSSCALVRVLLPQIGQWIHLDFSAYFPWVIPSFYPFILNWLRGFMSRERGLNDLLIALASDSEMVSHTASGVLPLVLLCVHVLVSGLYRRQAMLFQSKSLYL